MAVVDRAELIKRFSELLNDDTSDEVIQLTEDLSDTLSDYDKRVNDKEDWKTKFEENDAEWRKKYRERFENVTPKIIKKEEEIEEVKTYDDLFSEVK